MPRAAVNGIEIEYETVGDPSDPTLLLVMGLGAQLVAWDDDFTDSLAGRGFRVIRFDNRDVGLSTHLSEQAVSREEMLRVARRAQFRLPVEVPYGISDMAADAAGLLGTLGIERAHVAGVSMGGMIAQQLAIDFPDKVLSLTSAMSTTGEKYVGTAQLRVLRMLAKPGGTTLDDVVDGELAMWRLIGTRGTFDADVFVQRITRAYHRAFDPDGVTRQTMAVLAAPSRANGLRNLRVPTTVVHGTADPLVNVTGGLRTAWLVPGADLYLLRGHGHDLPISAPDRFTDAIVATCARASRVATGEALPASTQPGRHADAIGASAK